MGESSQHLLSDVGLPSGSSEFKAFGPAIAKKFPHHKRGNDKQLASKEDAVRVFGVSGQAHQVPRGLCGGYERGLSPIPKAQNSEPVSAICWEALNRLG